MDRFARHDRFMAICHLGSDRPSLDALAFSGSEAFEDPSLAAVNWPGSYQATIPQLTGNYEPALSVVDSSGVNPVGKALYLGEIAAGLINFNSAKGAFDIEAPSKFSWWNLEATVAFTVLVPVAVLAGIELLPVGASIALASSYALTSTALGFTGVAVGGIIGFSNVIEEAHSGN